MVRVHIVSAAIGVGLSIAASDAAVFDLVGNSASLECAGRSTCRLTVDGITATLTVNTGTFGDGLLERPFTFPAQSLDLYAKEQLDFSNAADDVPDDTPDAVTITFDQDVVWGGFRVSYQLAGEVSGVEFNGESFFPFDGSGAFSFFSGGLIRGRDLGGCVVLTAIAGQFNIDRFTVEPALGVDGPAPLATIEQHDEGNTVGGDGISSSFGGCLCDPTNDGFVDRLDLQTVIACASKGDCSRCVNSCDVNCDGIEADHRDIRAIVGVVLRGKACSQE